MTPDATVARGAARATPRATPRARKMQRATARITSATRKDARGRRTVTRASALDDASETHDVVVIGSGIGGLSCAALLAKYGYEVKVFESHYLAGGCCHMFDHRAPDGALYKFEVGPSIWEGLDRPTGNPLRMVLDALGETVPVKTYDGISMWTPEGHWRFQTGDDDAPGGFCDLLREKATDPELAIKEWKALKGRLEPLYDALDACPLTALRQDAGLLVSTVIAIPFYLTHPNVMLDIPYILDSFHKLSRQYVTEPFLKQWIDMLAFFSGFPAEGTMGATMIYSIPGFHRPGASLCAPEGGTQAVVDKLQYCLEKYGGELQLKSHVEEIIVEDGEAKGVRLRNGKVIKANVAVVSNATIWDTVPMLPQTDELIAQGLDRAVEWKDEMSEIPALGSIMHLFLGIDATGLPDLDPSHLCVLDWDRPLGDPQNVITISFPPCSILKSHPKVSTSFTCTQPEANRTTFGKARIEGVKSTRISSANALKSCGMPSNASYRTFVAASKLKCTRLRRRINGSSDGTAARTARRSQPAAASSASYLCPKFRNRAYYPLSPSYYVAATPCSRASAFPRSPPLAPSPRARSPRSPSTSVSCGTFPKLKTPFGASAEARKSGSRPRPRLSDPPRAAAPNS